MAKKSPPNFAEGHGPVLHSARWRFGAFELDEARRELSRQGELVEIEPKPLNMLMLMLRHPGELITKNDLMEALWTGRIVTESVLSNCVTKLRSVLGDEAGAPRIRNLHGYGYRLEASPELITELLPQAEAPLLQVESGVPFRPNWRLRRRLGLSGETWLAEQPHTGEQRVFKFAHTPRELSALKREVTLYRLLRQTLEDQAPVPDLLDWNFDEPPWFIEAEYCALGSLSDWLEAQGGARALPLETRLGLVIQLAEALGAVHAVGILHKDLKPANVLVSPARNGEVQLKLGDFGSGRLLDSTRLEALAITRLGFSQFVESGSSSTSGTPLYYAPEVLSGQPTTLKADIYALGVIFYQLVVGDLRRLFAPGWEASVEDELIREDIAAAAAGDPYTRLPDALLLAQRLRQLPARREERAREKAERERAAATVLALQRAEARRTGLMIAAGALALGLVASLALYWRAERARDAEALARRQAVASRDFVLHDVLGKLSAGDEPVRNLSVQQLMNAAAEKVGERFTQEPLLEAEVRAELGNVYNQLGLRDRAITQLDLAVAIHRKRLGEDEVRTIRTAGELLRLLLHDPRLVDRLPEFTAILRTAETRYGRNTIENLTLKRHIASAEYLLGRFQTAADQLQETLTGLLELGADDKFILQTRLTLAFVQLDLGDYAAAESSFSQVLSELIRQNGPTHYEVARTQMQLGLLYVLTARYDQAKKMLDSAQRTAEIWEVTPGDLRLTISATRTLMAVERKNLNEARSSQAETERLKLTNEQDNSAREYYDQYLAARIHRLGGKLELAREAIEKSYRLLLPDVFPEHPDLIMILLEQAGIECEMGDCKKAEKTLAGINQKALADLPLSHPLKARERQVAAAIAAGVLK